MFKILKMTLLPGVLLLMVVLAGLSITGVLPYKVYAVRTGSMKPTIPPKSAVVVDVHNYKIGHPVSYRKGGDIITHRLLTVHPDGTVDTKGDANKTMDPWHVKTSDIIGGVISAPPMLGYWLVYLKNPLGLASVAVSVLIFWLIWDLAGAGEKAKVRGPGVVADVVEANTDAAIVAAPLRAFQPRPVHFIDGLSFRPRMRA